MPSKASGMQSKGTGLGALKLIYRDDYHFIYRSTHTGSFIQGYRVLWWLRWLRCIGALLARPHRRAAAPRPEVAVGRAQRAEGAGAGACGGSVARGAAG